MQKIGKFYLAIEHATGAIGPEIFTGLGFVPLRVECRYDMRKFEYIGLSHQFAPIQEGMMAPEYEIQITEAEDPEDDSIEVRAVPI